MFQEVIVNLHHVDPLYFIACPFNYTTSWTRVVFEADSLRQINFGKRLLLWFWLI